MKLFRILKLVLLIILASISGIACLFGLAMIVSWVIVSWGQPDNPMHLFVFLTWLAYMVFWMGLMGCAIEYIQDIRNKKYINWVHPMG